MVKHFRFLTLPHSASTVANVFVHGYSSGHDLKDRRLLSRQIPSTLHNGINILGFWRSGHYLQVSNTTKQLAVAAGRLYPWRNGRCICSGPRGAFCPQSSSGNGNG